MLSVPLLSFRRPAARPVHQRLWSLKLGVLLLGVLAFGAAHAFGMNDVSQRAKELAQADYKPPPDKLPKELKDLAYDAFRDIRYKPDHAVWRGEKLPFELTFFHVGREFRDPVKINLMTPKGAEAVPFDTDNFDYGRNVLDMKQLKDVGYAGFRVHYAINRKDFKDEFLVFLGASYFRAVGKDQVYGLSGRALAVDVATSTGEEFPRFTEFWIERPTPKATSIVIYGLMDSKRVTGAYRFEVTPGAETQMNVSSVLYPRETIAKIGIAPLTSMFDFGENQPGTDDYRPEVHDSDGLSVWTGQGEWIWRPLVNPARLLVTSYAMPGPKGYGLMQRDRAYSSYEDPDDRYEQRPSTWVEPLGNWGAGRVELVQIPTPDETNDNIVAYWVPDKPVVKMEPLKYAYKLHWQGDSQTLPPNAWVTQTRRGRGYVQKPDGQLRLLIDFDGPALKNLSADAPVQAMVTVGGNAEITERVVNRNRVTGAWRVSVRMKREDINKPIELRAYLRLNDQPISETWSYILPSQPEKQ